MILAAGDVFMPFGNFDPLFAFRSGDPYAILSAVGILIGSVMLMMVASLIIRHKPLYQPLLLFALGTLFVLTIDYLFVSLIFLIAAIADFSPPSRFPPSGELSKRLSQFGFLIVISFIGLLPAYPLRRVIDHAPTRRFRRLLKKRRKQRNSDD